MSYIDTSVLVAYYFPENISDRVERFLRKEKAPTISPLCEVEIASAIARKLREGNLDRLGAAKILAEFKAHIADGAYAVEPLHTLHYELAYNWIASMIVPLRTLDALHLAIASEIGTNIITADLALSKAAKRLRIPCRLLK